MVAAQRVTTAAVVALALAGCSSGGSDSGSRSGFTGPSAQTPGTPGTGGVGAFPGTVTKPGTTFAYVSSFAGDALDVYDVATAQPVTNILVAAGPSDLAVDAAKSIHVASLKTKALEVYDSTTYALKQTVDLKTAPMSQFPILSFLDPIISFAYMPTGAIEGAPGKVYVPGLFTTTVVQNGVPVKGIMDIGAPAGGGTGLTAMLGASVESLGACRAAAANGKVYVTNFLSHTVTVIDTAIDDVVATVPVGRGPSGIAIDRNGIAWVACALDGEVYTIDTATNLVGSSFIVGVGPVEVACDNQNGFIYVANYLSGDIAKIDALTAQVVEVLAPTSVTSLMNALGLNQQSMQSMLNQMIASMGSVGNSGTSAGGLQAFLGALFGTNGAGGGGFVGSIMQNFMNTFFQQLNSLPNGGALPSAGIFGIDVSPMGDTIVVSNAVTGEISFIDTASKAIISYSPVIQGGAMFPLVTSVEIVER